MNNFVDQINQIIADSLVMYVKTHNYHWHIKGPHFLELHKFTSEVYAEYARIYDFLAEILVMNNLTPIVTIKQAIELSKLPEETLTSFTHQEVFNKLESDLDHFIHQFKDLAKMATDHSNLASFCDDTVSKLTKWRWMIRASNLKG